MDTEAAVVQLRKAVTMSQSRSVGASLGCLPSPPRRWCITARVTTHTLYPYNSIHQTLSLFLQENSPENGTPTKLDPNWCVCLAHSHISLASRQNKWARLLKLLWVSLCVSGPCDWVSLIRFLQLFQCMREKGQLGRIGWDPGLELKAGGLLSVILEC